jgi:hypothetical protein
MKNLSIFLAAGLAAFMLLLAIAPSVEAQVVVNRRFNPRTGRVRRSVTAYNPWTGGVVRTTSRGPVWGGPAWVGPPVRTGVVYSNPWIGGTVAVGGVAPNPWIQPAPVVWGAPGWRGW